ncbi:unnamed protein product [Caretta caretta]
MACWKPWRKRDNNQAIAKDRSELLGSVAVTAMREDICSPLPGTQQERPKSSRIVLPPAGTAIERHMLFHKDTPDFQL